MQTQYVDKYEQELIHATEVAERIIREEESSVEYMTYIGAAVVGRETRHYYKYHGTYYYESEFAKHMRLVHRRNKLQRYAKK